MERRGREGGKRKEQWEGKRGMGRGGRVRKGRKGWEWKEGMEGAERGGRGEKGKGMGKRSVTANKNLQLHPWFLPKTHIKSGEQIFICLYQPSGTVYRLSCTLLQTLQRLSDD